VAPEQVDKPAPATLGDLLTAPAADLLSAGTGMAAASGAAATPAGLTLAQRQMMDDELKSSNLVL